MALVLTAIGCSQGDDRATGELVVGEAWAGPSTGAVAVYLTIDNGGPEDRLVGARTEVAGSVGVMGDDGTGSHSDPTVEVDLDVPSGSLEFAPGGRHVMLSDLAGPLVAGDRFTLTLEFDRNGTRRAEVEVVDWDEVVERYEEGS